MKRDKEYPWLKPKSVHIPKTDWICKAILNGEIQIEYEDEYEPTVLRGDVKRVLERLIKLKIPMPPVSTFCFALTEMGVKVVDY